MRRNIFFDVLSVGAKMQFAGWNICAFDPSLTPRLKESKQPLYDYIEAVKDAFTADFTGSLPIGRVNFFKVFCACADFVKSMHEIKLEGEIICQSGLRSFTNRRQSARRQRSLTCARRCSLITMSPSRAGRIPCYAPCAFSIATTKLADASWAPS